MRSTDIVAYTHQAEIICPACVREAFMVQARRAGREDEFQGMGTEAILDWAASQARPAIDRQDERSFDSADFPKVVFLDQVTEPTTVCDGCETVILD